MKSSKNNKELILSLIKDDLINSKLVNGLNELGLDASKYFIHSSNTAFKLMEFQNHPFEEELFELYLVLSAKVKDLDISTSHAPLDALSLEIYEALLLKKNELMDADLKSKKRQ